MVRSGIATLTPLLRALRQGLNLCEPTPMLATQGLSICKGGALSAIKGIRSQSKPHTQPARAIRKLCNHAALKGLL